MHLGRRELIGGAVVGALAVAVAYGRRPKPLAVDAATVTRAPLETTVDADGRTRVRERYVIVAPVAGRVERIERVEGAEVRRGDIVARIRPLPLDSTSMAQARARVEAADALVLQAAAQARVAAAAADQRRREASRAERLAEAGGVAPRVVEESHLARLEAEESLRAATERSRAAEADARQARAVVDGQSASGGVPIAVRAPAAGRVLRVSERSERIVAAGTPLLEVGDPSSLEAVIDVLSSDAALIHPGDRVRIADWTGGDGTERSVAPGGRVREIEPAGFTKVSALGVEEQRVNVIIDLDAVPPVVGDGFRVEASVIVWATPSTTVVPRSALFQESGANGAGGGWRVFVISGGRAAIRTVRVGHAGDAGSEVLSGLGPGDQVVVFPSDQVKDGGRVSARSSS